MCRLDLPEVHSTMPALGGKGFLYALNPLRLVLVDLAAYTPLTQEIPTVYTH
jgi:hypothetical protein